MFTKQLSKWSKNLTVQKMIIIAINASNVFLMTPYRLNKDGSFGLSKFRCWLAWIISIMTAIGLGGRILTQLNLKQLNRDPYLLLAFCRVLYYYFYILLSIIIMNLRHGRIINILNKLREIDEIIKFKEKNLKMVFVKLCIQILSFYLVVALFTTLSVMAVTLSTFLDVLLFISFMYIVFVTILSELFFLDLIHLFGLHMELIHKILLIWSGQQDQNNKILGNK